MRRCSLVLSVLLAAGVAFGSSPALADDIPPPPDGEPMCSYVRTEGSQIPNIDFGDYCVWGYPYGQWCDTYQTYYGDNTVWIRTCYPGVY